MLELRSRKHLYYLLGTDKKELKEILKNIDDFYTPYFKVKKNKDGSVKVKKGVVEKRKICPSNGRLKDIQKRIKTRILSKDKFKDFIQGGVKGKDNISNANVHKGNKYFFTTDLKNFFPSVNNVTVYNTFVDNNFSADVSSVLTKLITYEGCVPQGIPTSTHITNLSTLPLDFELLKFSKKNNINYTRFVDDLSFSSKKDFKNLLPDILNIIEKNNLKINHSKTKYKIGPKEIIGIEVRNNIIKPSKAILSRYDKLTDEKKKQSLEIYINRIKKVSNTKKK